jgi:phosphorylcholine metabolism protein LicD
MIKENIFKDINKGFGEHKQIAINLLKKTIDILDEYQINYFLISGTLLGYVRHNDFIPWDDDIDLIVDKTIIDKLPIIYAQYNKELTFINKQNFLIKTCFKKDDNLQIKNINIKNFDKYILGDNESNIDTYTFPFIDLFVYNDNQHQNENIYKNKNENKNKLEFFNKIWEINEFFPPNKVLFNGILVSIPNNPDYFLKINYGSNYMTTLIPSSYNHREEKPIKIIKKNK